MRRRWLHAALLSPAPPAVAIMPATRRYRTPAYIRGMQGGLPRKNSTPAWRNLRMLYLYNAPLKIASAIEPGKGRFDDSNYNHDDRSGNANFSFVKHGILGGGMGPTASQGWIIGAAADRTRDYWVGQNVVDQTGFTIMMVWSVQTGQTSGTISLQVEGGFNQTEGWSLNGNGSSSQFSFQNGTGGRGSGDVASLQFSGVSAPEVGQVRCAIGAVRPSGHLLIAHKAWDRSGHNFSGEDQVDGTPTCDSDGNQAFAFGFGSRVDMAGLAVWHGAPFSKRRAEHVAQMKNPMDIFYG